MEVILMAFPKKFLFRANGPFRIQNVTSCLETGCEISQLWISCKDCFTILHNERGQERHGNYINGFFERNLIVFRAIWLFWNKNGMMSSSLWICPQVFILIKGTKKYMKIFLVVFWEKISFGQFDLFRSIFNVWLGVVKIEPGHCNYWILKQSGHDFSGKRLCGRYCTSILCDVYVWRSLFKTGSYGFVKKLL